MSDLSISYPIQVEALDIQHDTDPADDHGKARRIPHLGHAALFFALVIACLLVCLLGAYAIAHVSSGNALTSHPGLALATQAAGYSLALILSAWFFPILWQRSFLAGIEWNTMAAGRRWGRLISAAIVLSLLGQAALHFVHLPKDAPIDEIFQSRHIAYIVAILGVIFGPIMEEIAFRGFLLPALATAYDWVTFPRTPAGLDRWQRSTAHTKPALITAALLSSIPFALMHAAQIGHAWGVVGILYGVSLVFSYVRIRTHSVACSTLMHATYNFTIFAGMFIATSGFRHLDVLAK
jgi:membrane protease YdiL (CAAX protease family)